MSNLEIHKSYSCYQSEEEQMALEKFRAIVADLDHDDVCLLRFLRARELNLDNAEKMLRVSVQWKKENDIATILNRPPPKYLKDEYHIWFQFKGHDHKGRPVAWIPLGGVFAKECIEAGHKEILYEWIYYLLECAMNSVKENEKEPQVVAVLGLEDLALKKIMHMETMQALYKGFQALEQNYPEILKYLIVINAPWYFNIAYNFVKPILSAHTISKLHVFNSNRETWMGFLRDIMPEESIFERYRDT